MLGLKCSMCGEGVTGKKGEEGIAVTKDEWMSWMEDKGIEKREQFGEVR